MRAFFRGLAESILHALDGGRRPRDVAAAVALGILIGAITGANISWLLLLLVVVLLNVPLRLFAAVWAGSVLNFGCARGALERLGRLLLDATPLGQKFGRFGDGAFLALLGWHQPAFAGGCALGLLLAGAGAAIVYWFRRSSVSPAAPDDPDLPPGLEAGAMPAWELYRATTDVAPAVERYSLRIVADDQERPVRTTRARRLRPHGFALAAAASLLLAPACWWVAGSVARRNFVAILSAWNGGNVSAGGIDLSLWTGEFVARDVSATDPERPDRVRLSIGQAIGVLSPGLLLRGQLDINSLVLTNVRAEKRPSAADVHSCDALAADSSLGTVDIGSALPNWKDVCHNLAALQRLVAAIEDLTVVEASGVERPLVRVRQLRVADFATCSSLGPRALLELAELSSHPQLAEKPAELKVVAPKFGGELTLVFSQSGASAKHRLRLSVYDLDLPSLVAVRRLAVAAGKVSLSGEGWLNRRAIDAWLAVEINALDSEIVGGNPWVGIDPSLVNRCLERVHFLKADLLLTGKLRSPALRADSRALARHFQEQLRSAGENELAMTLERELDRPQGETQLTVVPVSAVEPQANPPRTGWAGFTQPAPVQELAAAAMQHDGPAAAELAGDSHGPGTYPVTATPYGDLPAEPQPAAPTTNRRARIARPLPGPMNLVVGRDRAIGLPSTFDQVGAVRHEEPIAPSQPSMISRLAHSLRERFRQSVEQPTASPSADPPVEQQTIDRTDAVIPAAASEAWYNRRWR